MLMSFQAQVRFQSRSGRLLAAASENVLSIFDVETGTKTHYRRLENIRWDNNGEFLASVSGDSVKVWSLLTGDCIHELRGTNNRNKFNSCVFHPNSSSLLVMGGYQKLELRNIMVNQTMTGAGSGWSDF